MLGTKTPSRRMSLRRKRLCKDDDNQTESHTKEIIPAKISIVSNKISESSEISTKSEQTTLKIISPILKTPKTRTFIRHKSMPQPSICATPNDTGSNRRLSDSFQPETESPEFGYFVSQLPGTQECEVIWDCNSPGFTKEDIKKNSNTLNIGSTSSFTSQLEFMKSLHSFHEVTFPVTNQSIWKRNPRRRPPKRKYGIGNRKRNKWEQKRKKKEKKNRGLFLWIDKQQVQQFSGYNVNIDVVSNGKVVPFILDPQFEDQLPIIPPEFQGVNLTWKSQNPRYNYDFSILKSNTPENMKDPILSVSRKGKVPKKPKTFRIELHCHGNTSGIATFEIGLIFQIRLKKAAKSGSQSIKEILPNTSLRLSLKKMCYFNVSLSSLTSACIAKCANGGICDHRGHCHCPGGYGDPTCSTPICNPGCQFGGVCTAPGNCKCPTGYHGRFCEGGICEERCENGGKCIQKDTCSCQKGFYGNTCQFSKCVIPCVNGGRCKGKNRCKCSAGFSGAHCQKKEKIANYQLQLQHNCTIKCRRKYCKNVKHCLYPDRALKRRKKQWI